MSMVVRTNIMAMNSNRSLGINNSNVSKSLEKLSSGFRINRAADDASGLAISEKMKSQIKGLEQASTNSQDGISLIQTAEGATTEIHNMLNRMKELAIKSANGTIQDEVDREAIQAEVDALNEEITRIAKSTTFNGIQLLDGSLGSSKAAFAGYDVATFVASADVTVTDIAGISLSGGSVAPAPVVAGDKVGITNTAGVLSVEVIGADGNGTITELNLADHITFSGTGAKGDTGTIDLTSVGLGKIEFTVNTATTAADLATDAGTALATLFPAATPLGGTPASGGTGTGLTLQVGDTADDFNKVTVGVDDLSAEGLKTANGGVDVSTETASAASVDVIEAAINQVSTNRANLGALQNRLEYTINNLDVTAENMSAANSRIRDTDMAKEMMAFTQGNVLTQAAQAMLAQANQQPQAILQLLQ